MSSNRGRVIPAQMIKLLDLLSEDGVLLQNGKIMYTYTTKQCFWKRIATQLNSVQGGVYKNTWKWCKMWADWKAKTKKKANILLKRKHYDCEQPVSSLSNLELRLLKLIEYPVDDLSQQQLEITVNKEELSDNAEPQIECMAFDDGQNGDRGLEDESSQHATNQPTNNEPSFYRVNVPYDNTKDNLEECSDSDTNSKSADRFFSRRIRLQDLKKVLPNDKAQRSEELRLKALELKLKGEELRLKEMEMNKINYLTNIEEEKLKCFRDISNSLKELVELSRNGNIRFNNVV